MGVQPAEVPCVSLSCQQATKDIFPYSLLVSLLRINIPHTITRPGLYVSVDLTRSQGDLCLTFTYVDTTGLHDERVHSRTNRTIENS